jgi:uncharacterized alpha-E superfamily protein
MLQDEAFRFIRMGSFLERADNTARILDVKYQAIELGAKEGDAASEYYQWSALLRSVSGFEAYRKVYRDLITPRRVAELLVLRADMPRSLARSLKEVYTNLCEVANRHSGETERRAGGTALIAPIWTDRGHFRYRASRLPDRVSRQDC